MMLCAPPKLVKPAYREGNIIDLGFTQLQVVDACSGLNSLISLFVLGLLLVYFFKAYLWKRVILLISTVPIAIFANSMRIALTAFLYKFWGPEVAEGFFHLFSRLLIFLVCIPVLLVEMWFLGRIPPVFPSLASGRFLIKRVSVPVNPAGDGVRSMGSGGTFFQGVFIAAALLFGATLVLSYGIDFHEKIPGKKTFEKFPLQVKEWTGTRITRDLPSRKRLGI